MRRVVRTCKKRFKIFKSIVLPKSTRGRYYGIRVPVYGRVIKYAKKRIRNSG